MSNIYGLLGLEDSDRAFVNTIGQRAVYDAIIEELNRINSDVEAARSVFVERVTEDFKFRYKLPMGGYMQRRGVKAPAGLVKGSGKWDVAFPLFDFGDELGGDDVTIAYMTMQELDAHIDGIEARNMNTLRREILVAMFNSTQFAFEDEVNGTLNVEGFANGDTVVYPPVIGATAGAIENHYAVTGYTVANISDTNDPCETAVDELEEHFGANTGGSELVMFVGKTLGAKIAGTLTDFVAVSDMHVSVGDDTATVLSLPASLPGKILGRHESGIWVVEWRYIPDNFSLTIHLEARKPLIMRVDPADTGLGTGLQLVATSDKTPLQSSFYRNRYGLGVGNRLNGYVQYFAASGSYAAPTALAR